MIECVIHATVDFELHDHMLCDIITLHLTCSCIHTIWSLLYVCAWVYVCICVHLCTCVHVCTCACVRMCVCESVCVFAVMGQAEVDLEVAF